MGHAGYNTAMLWVMVVWVLVYACWVPAEQTHAFPTSSPAAQQLDGERLNELVRQIEAGEFGDIHSLLILRNDTLVLEKYFLGFTRESLRPIYSVTKSITSALIGQAVADGAIRDLDAKLLAFFPQYPHIAHRDHRKEAITVAHVLTMTAGFSWDEISTSYGSAQNDASKLAESPDWLQYILDLPVVDPPGSRFIYNSGCTLLLGGILAHSLKPSVTDYARATLFNPLGITHVVWEHARVVVNTGWGLHLRPIDMAKIGQLYLHQGRWAEQQVLPAHWVEQSTASHVTVGETLEYGYQWWRFSPGSRTTQALRTNDVFFGWGYGGQFIFVVPHLRMVVVSTARNFPRGDPTFEMLRAYIFPSVLD